MIAVVRQVVARGLLGLTGRWDPNTYSAQMSVSRELAAIKPGKALEADGADDPPTPYRDDSTAQAARRLIEFMGS